MTQAEETRTVVIISNALHKSAKAAAALRGCTLRELVEEAIRKEILGKPSGEVRPPEPIAEKKPQEAQNKALEDAVAAHLEKEVEKAKAEHERRIAAGILKG
jgi:hypothetical protein